MLSVFSTDAAFNASERCLSSVEVLADIKASEHRAGDDFFHDFRSSGIYLLHAGICPGSGNRVFSHVAVAAKQLHADIGDLKLRFSRPKLSHRCGRDVELL